MHLLKRTLLLTFLVLLVGAWSGAPHSTYAQTQQPQLQVTPTTLTLAPNEHGQALVVARQLEANAQNLTLEYFAEPVVTVEIELTQFPGAQNGDVVWKVKITRSATGRSNGKIFFWLAYLAPNEQKQLTRHVLTTTLEVQERAPASLDTIVDAKLETALDNIQDQKMRTVFVVLTNKSTVPVTITQIIPQPIAHFTPVPQDVGSGVVLQPQETRPFTITVVAGDQVEVGKQLLVVQAHAMWEKDGQRVNGALVLSKEFQVGVFGEQEILTATAIPSFLLLPGFLFVLTGLLLLKWSWKKEPIALDFKKPEFWIFAITLSLLTVVFYPWLTRIALSIYYQRDVSGRDLRQGYGFTDVLYLWVGAVIAAVVLWAVLSAIVIVVQRIQKFLRQRYAQSHYATAEDEPMTILNKLANNKLGFALDQVEFKRDNKSQIVFTLPRELGAPDGKRWLVPAALVTIQGQGAQERKEKLAAQLEQSDDARGMENLLRTWGDKIVQARWEQAGPDALVRKPMLVDTAETIDQPNARQPFLLSL